MIATSQGEVVSLQTVWEFLKAGGPVMIPIGICSVLALAYALERYLRLTRRRILPSAIYGVLAKLEAGDQAGAREQCEAIDAPAARILMAGFRREGFAPADVEKAIEDQGKKELDRLRTNIRPLTFIGNVAPLLGLFGTVVGIYDAFHTIRNVGMGKPELFAGGIEVALITTIAGLIVAIPAIVVAAHLQRRLRGHLLAVDQALSPAVERLARAGAVHAA
jgi:biopolymer transport protein ExbB